MCTGPGFWSPGCQELGLAKPSNGLNSGDGRSPLAPRLRLQQRETSSALGVRVWACALIDARQPRYSAALKVGQLPFLSLLSRLPALGTPGLTSSAWRSRNGGLVTVDCPTANLGRREKIWATTLRPKWGGDGGLLEGRTSG